MATWTIDPSHSTAEFAVKHMMFTTVRGDFSNLEGTLEFDPENKEAAYIEATIPTTTVYTRDEQRDNNLRSADFFEVENYPAMTFKSTDVNLTGENTAKVTGNLTIRGVTNTVTFDAVFEGQGQDPWGNQRLGFSASTKINRKDWGLNWNQALEAGGVLVGETVIIEVNLQAIPAQVSEEAQA